MSPATLPLPPLELRFMGENDALFMRIADENVQLLERFGFKPDSAILDIGSGYGRLVYGILNKFDFRGTYVGVDILPPQVQWCRENISRRFARFRFDLIDVRNDRYNPHGTNAAGAFHFTLPDRAFNFCTLFSVFTHMYEEDIRQYLSEVRRVLRPNATVVATFFLFDDARLKRLGARKSGLAMKHELNAHTRYHNPEDKLHAIAFERAWTQQMIEEAGFEVLEINYGHWAGDPSVYYQDQVIFTNG
jgi:SAM-dependent methyltransferase